MDLVRNRLQPGMQVGAKLTEGLVFIDIGFESVHLGRDALVECGSLARRNRFQLCGLADLVEELVQAVAQRDQALRDFILLLLQLRRQGVDQPGELAYVVAEGCGVFCRDQSFV